VDIQPETQNIVIKKVKNLLINQY